MSDSRRQPPDPSASVRLGLRDELAAIARSGAEVQLDVGVAGIRLCRILDTAGVTVTGTGASVDEAAADALRLWVAARRRA